MLLTVREVMQPWRDNTTMDLLVDSGNDSSVAKVMDEHYRPDLQRLEVA